MCGIAGLYNFGQHADDLVSRMISILRHRGPDETGLYIDPQIALGHARLSIVGLGNGTQPICNEDESLWVVYNGEIFNYPELRSKLENKGHMFTTDTDTEVLVHLYEEYGSEGLKLLNGQFAFAIWDSNKKELFLARDSVGILPLFYYHSGKKLIFASEIKAIFLDNSVPREIEPQALSQVFTCWANVTPKTLFKDIYELPPGYCLLLKDEVIVYQKPFWTLPYYRPEDRWQGSFNEAVEELKALLMDAIRIRLRADVPVGAYLSGGLDSSIITSLISRSFNNNLRTFSLSFAEEAFDESPYQQEMVRHLKTDHTQVTISNADISRHFSNVVWHCEKPLLRTAPIPMFLLSQLVRENNFKVVLTGEGSDEIFGGYNIFKEAKIRELWSRNPDSHLRPLLLERLYPYIFKNPSRERIYLQKFFAVNACSTADPLFSHRIRWANTGKNTTFFSHEMLDTLDGYRPEKEIADNLPMGFADRDVLSRAQFLEMDIFMSNYLLSSQGDRVAMANSLELRVPFLDFRVIDFAMKLPAAWKLKVLNEKYILKEAFRSLVPESIVSRPKHPYRAPIRDVFFGDKNSYAYEYLSEGYLKKTGYFDVRKTSHLVRRFVNDAHFVESETQNMALVGILSTQILHHQFVEDFDARDIKPHQVDKRVVRP
jgi:asparagine synthase (glutamine-hydrolysing)